MSVKFLQVTIGAGATQVNATQKPARQVIVQNNAANVVRVGDSTVSASKGIKLAASSAANSIVTLGTTGGAPSINLADLWLSGTQNDIIDIAYLP